MFPHLFYTLYVSAALSYKTGNGCKPRQIQQCTHKLILQFTSFVIHSPTVCFVWILVPPLCEIIQFALSTGGWSSQAGINFYATITLLEIILTDKVDVLHFLIVNETQKRSKTALQMSVFSVFSMPLRPKNTGYYWRHKPLGTQTDFLKH